jgi:hypothetical protein
MQRSLCSPLLERALIGVTTAIFLVANAPGYASPLTAKSETSWGFFDWTDNPHLRAESRGGTWTLGKNYAYVLSEKKDGPKTGRYSLNGDLLVQLTEGTGYAVNATATAGSVITIVNTDVHGWTTYDFHLKAVTDVDWLSPSASAIAKAEDPQYFSVLGLFGGGLRLLPGSSIFESRPEADMAESALEIFLQTNSGLTSLISLQLAAVGGAIDAHVVFASDSRLRVYDPISGATLTSSMLEQSLRNASGLGSLEGLPSSLSLFQYTFDASGLSLDDQPAMGMAGVNYAYSPVPEPRNFELLACGAALLAAGLARRRKREREHLAKH